MLLNHGTNSAPTEMKMQPPRTIGGRGEGANPEQLFAAGYAACFASALRRAAAVRGKHDAVRDARTHVDVALGQPTGKEGFGVEVKIAVEGCDDNELIRAAHEVRVGCPGAVCADVSNNWAT
jgi:Ohr subfamily peroxiredoxin